MKTLFYNGTIITVNDNQPTAEALLVEDGRILAVGSLDSMEALKDDTIEEVDLCGKTMLPGFIDGHGHIANVLASLPKLYPPPNGIVNSKEHLFSELRRMIDNNEILDNGWFLATGYDTSFFEDLKHPTRYELDEISKNIPMLVMDASGGHVGVVNSKAIELAGWTKDTPNPEGGMIQRNTETGELTGYIEEKAIHLVALGMAIVGLSIENLADNFFKTQEFYAKNGITTAQDGGTLKETLELFDYCKANNKMLIDVVSYPMEEYIPEAIPDNSDEQGYDRHIKFAGAKVVADGSPQAKTAWLTQPYYKIPAFAEEGYSGYPIYTDEQMYEFCKKSLLHNWQLLVHCNGDATGDQFIRNYRKAKEDTHHTKDLRPVMIHAQTVREDQLDEMKALGIMPSYFHDHVFYWGDHHYNSVLGPERANKISPLAPSVERGMKFTLHNDMPVTPINPIFNIHVAANRLTRKGRLLGPEYRIDTMEAIRAVTIYGAYQHFDEKIKGSLEVGKYADLVILNKNPLETPNECLKDIKVLETIKEGKTIFKAD